jgi:hypothetical protein
VTAARAHAPWAFRVPVQVEEVAAAMRRAGESNHD